VFLIIVSMSKTLLNTISRNSMDGHVGEKGKDSSQSWKAEGLLLGLGESADHRGKFRLQSSLQVFNAAALSASSACFSVLIRLHGTNDSRNTVLACHPTQLHPSRRNVRHSDGSYGLIKDGDVESVDWFPRCSGGMISFRPSFPQHCEGSRYRIFCSLLVIEHQGI